MSEVSEVASGSSLGVRIRAAQATDATALAPLVEQLGYPTSPAQMRLRLEAMQPRADYAAWVAETDRVVGFVGACVGYSFVSDEPYGRILALVVDAGERGRGIGGQLLREAETWIAGRGGTLVVISSGKHRVEAHRFYEGAGYAATGLRFAKSIAPSRAG